MIKQLTAAFLLFVWLVSASYLALLTNWFQESLSLEGSMVALPLIVAVALVTVLAAVSYFFNSKYFLWAALVAAVAGGGFVVHRQLDAFGGMPSFYMTRVNKSPMGIIKSPKGEIDYWIELINPFTKRHREYLMVKQGDTFHSIQVPIFLGPAKGYVEASKVEDWGKLAKTTKRDVFIFTVNKAFSPAGRFRVNLATGKVVKIKS